MPSVSVSEELDAFEAALEFIEQYQLSDDEGDAFDSAAPASLSSHRPSINLTSHFQRSHSLELPDQAGPAGARDDDIFSGDLSDVLLDPIQVNVKDEGELMDLNTLVEGGELELNQISPFNPPRSTGGAYSSFRARRKPRPVSRRQELFDLRKTVKDLSEQLESMRATSSPASSPVSSPSSGSPMSEEARYVSSLLSQPESIWENLAARQLAARKDAEEENEMLKAAVDQQSRHARNLKRRIKRQASSGVRPNRYTLMWRFDRANLTCLDWQQEVGRLLDVKRFKALAPSELEDIFAELERDMDELYVSVDEKFAAAEMDALPCPGRKRQVKRSTVSGVFIELMDCNLVPFKLHAAEKAVWTSLGERGLRYRHEFALDFKVC